MGVLAKLFKRSQPAKDGRKSRPVAAGADSTIESKPIPASSQVEQSDQAAKLRQAVRTANTDATAESQLQAAIETDAWEVQPTDSGDGSLSLSDHDDEDEDALPEAIADRSSGESVGLTRKPRSPRSKQELIEELHRNYQEVLGLIRKLDGHLDDARGRSETITEVAEQYAKLAPVIESLPSHLTERSDRLSEDIRESIGAEGAAARELLERIESAIVHVGTDIERSTDQQGRLVQTMAEFRESLTDLSRSSTAACESVRDSESRAAERDQALLAQLQQTRLWLIGLTVGVGAIGVAALILGVLSLGA